MPARIPFDLARNQDRTPRFCFGDLAMFMCAVLGFTETRTEFHWHVFMRDGLLVKVSKKIVGLRSDDSDWNYEFECFDPVTDEKMKKKFLIKSGSSSMDVLLLHSNGYNNRFCVLENLGLLIFRIELAVLDFENKGHLRTAKPTGPYVEFCFDSIKVAVTDNMKKFGFVAARDEGCPCWTFNNAKHGITLGVWLEPDSTVSVTKSTTRCEPIEIQKCEYNTKSICDTMQSFLA